MTGDRTRFVLMDSLRAIAALMVFGFHLVLAGLWLPPDTVGRFARHLSLGVPIFFVISGFLLYRPFVRARMEGAARPALWPYGARRATRIFPAYWLALYVSAALITLPGVLHWPDGLLSFGLAQIYVDGHTLDGLPQAWSIGVELSFYVFLPLWAGLMRMIPARSPRAFAATEAAGLLVLFAAGVVWKLVISGPEIIDQFFSPVSPMGLVLPNYLDQFAFGMALAVVSVRVAGRERVPAPVRLVERRSWLPWLAAAGLFVLIGADTGLHDVELWPYTLQHELAGLFGVAMVLPAVFGQDHGGAVRRVLGWSVLVWVGMVSYGVYLWHVTVERLVAEHHGLDRLGTIGSTAVALAGTLAVAAASWYGLERWAIAWGRRAGRGDHTPPEPARERIAEAHRAGEPMP